MVVEHLEEMLPIIYTPTIGDAVKSFSRQYRRNRGIYLNYSQMKDIPSIIKQHITSDVKMVIITDGEGVLGIGDWGVGGMDIAIGKLMVYIANSNINPSHVMPICLDVGTCNEDLINDPHYIGSKEKRIREDQYFEFIDSIINTLTKINPSLYIHFEDFGRMNARRVLDRYQKEHCTFNDDIEGTGLIALATIMSATAKTKKSFTEHRFVILGPGSAGLGIADTLKNALMKFGLSEQEATDRIWMVGKFGLLTQDHNIRYPDQKIYARKEKELCDGEALTLLETIKYVKPTVLIGCSGAFGSFNEDIIKTMYSYEKHPIIMPLSNPISCCEVTPLDALTWTEGNALIATGSPFDDVVLDGKVYNISQCNNAYIFPGLGQGIIMSKAKKLTLKMLLAASESLSRTWNTIKGQEGKEEYLLPPLNKEYQKISYEISKAVALQAIEDGVTDLSAKSIDQSFKEISWDYQYYQFSKLESDQ